VNVGVGDKAGVGVNPTGAAVSAQGRPPGSDAHPDSTSSHKPTATEIIQRAGVVRFQRMGKAQGMRATPLPSSLARNRG